jgi:hypothetical protein
VQWKDKIGDGKSWFDRARLTKILACLESEGPRLMLGRPNAPAIVHLQKFEVVLAPAIMAD